MTFDEYQQQAKGTAVYMAVTAKFMTDLGLTEEQKAKLGPVLRLFYSTIGDAGEMGEFANKIKKVVRDHGGIVTPELREVLKGELGDQLWYISDLATELGIPLSEIAQYNVEKLTRRKDKGSLHGSGDNR